MGRYIVVGGSKGIGEACAEMLLQEGHDVITCQRHSKTMDYAANGDQQILGHQYMDLTMGLPALFEDFELAVAKLGGVLDGIVLSGGMGAYQRSVYASIVRQLAKEEPEDEDIAILLAKLYEYETTADKMIQTNLVGPAHVLELAYPYLAETGGRAIVIGSRIPRNCPADLAWYGTTKAGIETFLKASQRRWIKRGVGAMVLATGWVNSPMIEEIKPEKKKKILSRIGIGRFMEPAEIADDVRHLLFEAHEGWFSEVIGPSGGLF